MTNFCSENDSRKILHVPLSSSTVADWIFHWIRAWMHNLCKRKNPNSFCMNRRIFFAVFFSLKFFSQRNFPRKKKSDEKLLNRLFIGVTRISRSNRSQKHANTATMARSLSFLPKRGTETLISFLCSSDKSAKPEVIFHRRDFDSVNLGEWKISHKVKFATETNATIKTF